MPFKKPQKVVVPDNNPFQNDKLERGDIANALTQAVEGTNDPFTISIEAPWGWGKSTFVEMWKKQLINNGFTCMLFSAWEADYSDDPIVTFVGELDKFIEQSQIANSDRPKLNRKLKSVRKMAGKVILGTLPLLTQIVTAGIIDAEKTNAIITFFSKHSKDISEEIAEGVSKQIEKYRADRETIKHFKHELKELAEALTEGKKPLVIVIDELDRCKPTFAIQFLERIKHLLNIENVLFVLAIDPIQLGITVRSVYGQATDTDGYLRRLIDYRFVLPEPPRIKFCEHLTENFGMPLTFRAEDHIEDDFAQICSFAFGLENLSLRAQEQCFLQIHLVLSTLRPFELVYNHLVPVLVVFKYYQPEFYNKFRAGNNFPFSEIYSKYSSGFVDGIPPEGHRTFWIFEALHAINLPMGYLRDSTIEHATQRTQQSGRTDRDAKILDFIRIFSNYTISPIKHVIERIDLLTIARPESEGVTK